MRELLIDVIGNKFGEGVKREYQYRMAYQHLDSIKILTILF